MTPSDAPHSYEVAPRHGLTPVQHMALRAIGNYPDPHLTRAPISDKDIPKVTLEALARKRLITRRAYPHTGIVYLGDTWRDFVLTPDGDARARAVGAWRP